MKTLLLAIAAAGALAIPGIASAGSATVWDPANSAFETHDVGANADANHAAAVASQKNYTTASTYWDPANSAFETDKVGDSAAVVGTHEAPRTRAQALQAFLDM